MRGIYMVRRFVERRNFLNFGSVIRISSAIHVSSLPDFSIPSKPLFCTDFSTYTTTKSQSLSPSLQFQRTLCSSPDNSKVVLIKSEEQFNTSMNNVQDKSLPAIFYFTAAWCGPCKFISPILTEESKKYPDVTTYKIDIDQEGLRSKLNQLFISAVPTLHFFQNGKKAAEIVGADVERIKDTMEELYGKD
ncbi:thioredoxin O2, mitochondrial [Ricinus communis]|uniref:thioredoxin O2, mitochondrial n=1 Tax=Ricinus communis TaxID=3988 RepID=UPI000772141A|nr:thioredoxin O2, mitochondrial [Ricinus communis]|eukprot:XP_015583986.1 thioredoxin O2, mitochondrial isoform X2 [Ricinus communis]